MIILKSLHGYEVKECSLFEIVSSISSFFNKKNLGNSLLFVQGIPLVCMLASAAPVGAQPLGLGAFADYAERCGPGVATLTLAAIAKTESGFEPLVVADNETRVSKSYETLEQATSAAERAIAEGHSVDIGLMQINSANLKRLGMKARDALDPCGAIQAAAAIMAENFRASRDAPTQRVALRNALSMYNTGNTTHGYKNGYVQKVEDAAKSLSAYFADKSSEDLNYIFSSSLISNSEMSSGSWDVWNFGKNVVSSSGGDASSENVYIF